MTLYTTLAREHRLFMSLFDRLDRCMAQDDETACREARGALLVILPALDRHEELEERVFGGVPADDPLARRARAQIARQHAALDEMKRELRMALSLADARRPTRLPTLILPLTKRLRRHFWLEENLLWPRYPESSRSLTRSAQRDAARRVRELEREVALNWDLVAEHLDGRT